MHIVSPEATRQTLSFLCSAENSIKWKCVDSHSEFIHIIQPGLGISTSINSQHWYPNTTWSHWNKLYHVRKQLRIVGIIVTWFPSPIPSLDLSRTNSQTVNRCKQYSCAQKGVGFAVRPPLPSPIIISVHTRFDGYRLWASTWYIYVCYYHGQRHASLYQKVRRVYRQETKAFPQLLIHSKHYIGANKNNKVLASPPLASDLYLYIWLLILLTVLASRYSTFSTGYCY